MSLPAAGLAAALARITGASFEPAPLRRLGGGLHQCYLWRCSGGEAFVKIAPAAAYGRLEAEVHGLLLLARASPLRVPAVLGSGTTAQDALLVLEYLDPGEPDARAQARCGAGLAALHANHAPGFGLERDNFVGTTPQHNAWCTDWAEFFRERRLRIQLELARERGFGSLYRAGLPLLHEVARLLSGHSPAPSLLHGDLWGGNWFAAADGTPVIFDPAVYYGDRETDLAMTRLFGGFGPAFYRAYEAAAPLPPGWQQRARLYDLYHLLNHANLFGGAYASGALALIEALRAGRP